MINLSNVRLWTHGVYKTNQSGCFPVMFDHGNAYATLFYVYHPNYIKSVLIKNGSKEELLQIYMEMYAWLTACGYHSLLYKLDNKTSRNVEVLNVSSTTEPI